MAISGVGQEQSAEVRLKAPHSQSSAFSQSAPARASKVTSAAVNDVPNIASAVDQIVVRLMSPLSRDEAGHRSSECTAGSPHQHCWLCGRNSIPPPSCYAI